MRGVTFVESHIQDGAIFVIVQINGIGVVPTLMLTLEDWDHLRSCAEEDDSLIGCLNRQEAKDAELVT